MKISKAIITVLSIVSLILCSFSISSESPIPSVEINDLEGNVISTSSFANGGKPYVIVLWATWSKPAILELTELESSYSELQAETGCKIIAVSIDDARNKSKVKPFVEGREWEYEVYNDPSSKFKSALNAANVPMTYIVNSKNKIVWTREGFEIGDVDKITAQLKSTK